MLESFDFFLIAAIICMFILTGFLAWVLFYVATILRDVRETTTQLRNFINAAEARIQTVLSTIETMRDKVSSSASSINSVVSYIGRFVDHWQQERHHSGKEKSDHKKKN